MDKEKKQSYISIFNNFNHQNYVEKSITSLILNFRILSYIMKSILAKAVGTAISRAYRGRLLEVDEQYFGTK